MAAALLMAALAASMVPLVSASADGVERSETRAIQTETWLMEEADRLYSLRDDADSALRGLDVLRQGAAISPDSYGIQWRIARICWWIAVGEGDTGVKRALGQEGWNAGEKAVALDPTGVEGHYWTTLAIAECANSMSILAAITLGIDGRFNTHPDMVLAVDEGYDDGGALRAKGVYWFSLPGRMRNYDKSLERLERANELVPSHPRTLPYLAEVHHAMGDDKAAQEVNYSQLGRELGLTHQTARRWLDIMQAAFQWFEVPAWSGNVVKRVSSRTKGYLSDTGVACAAQAIASPHVIGGHPLQGALFESAVASELRKQTSWISPRPNLYHWRSHGGAEVDLVFEYNGALYPVEIKATTNPARRDTTGLSAFRKTYPDARVERGLVIAPVERPMRLTDNDTAVPWDLAPVGDR